MPAAGSELIGSADFSDSYLADNADFFETADYRGAFDPSLAMNEQWTSHWTNFDPQGTTYDGVSAVNDVVPGMAAQLKAYPNPFNPATTIQFSAPHAGSVKLTVFNARGLKVATLFEGQVESGRSYSVDFNGEGLSSGTYFCRIEGKGFTSTQKMQPIK